MKEGGESRKAQLNKPKRLDEQVYVWVRGEETEKQHLNKASTDILATEEGTKWARCHFWTIQQIMDFYCILF